MYFIFQMHFKTTENNINIKIKITFIYEIATDKFRPLINSKII